MTTTPHSSWAQQTDLGLSREHTLGLIVPLLAAVSPMWLSTHVIIPSLPMPINAILSGVVIGILTYLLFTFIPFLKEDNILTKATLCGILVAEVMIVGPFYKIPAMGTILLWLFLYYHVIGSSH